MIWYCDFGSTRGKGQGKVNRFSFFRAGMMGQKVSVDLVGRS